MGCARKLRSVSFKVSKRHQQDRQVLMCQPDRHGLIKCAGYGREAASFNAMSPIPRDANQIVIGAVFTDGRWQWLTAPEGAARERCPACLRIHDQFPAGYVNLTGLYINDHRTEILSVVHNLESKEKAEHPLQRVMNIVEDSSGVQITTTDIHLARAIGDALHRAHGGKLEVKYGADDNLVRVAWNR